MRIQRTISRWMMTGVTACAVGASATFATMGWLEEQPVPVERLAQNLQAFVDEHPTDAADRKSVV